MTMGDLAWKINIPSLLELNPTRNKRWIDHIEKVDYNLPPTKPIYNSRFNFSKRSTIKYPPRPTCPLFNAESP
jgi:hypothetical protein